MTDQNLADGAPMRLYDTARRAVVPFEPEPGRHHVHVRHHALRRHPPRPRRHLRHLRRAAAAPARPRPRDPLRPQHHRRRRRHPPQGPRARGPLPRPGRGRDGPLRRRHGGAERDHQLERAAGHRRPSPTSGASSAWSSTRATPTQPAAPSTSTSARFERFGQVSHYSRDEMLELARSHGGNPDDPNKRDPLDFVLWQPSRRGRAGVGVAVGPGPARLAHRVLGAGPARARHHHRPPRRRHRPDLPAPRVRGRPERGRHRPALRAPLDAPGDGPHGRREDVEVARQPRVRQRPAARPATPGRSASASSCTTTATRGSGTTRSCPPRPPASTRGSRPPRRPAPSTAPSPSPRCGPRLDDDLDTPGAVAAVDAAAGRGRGPAAARSACPRRRPPVLGVVPRWCDLARARGAGPGAANRVPGALGAPRVRSPPCPTRSRSPCPTVPSASSPSGPPRVIWRPRSAPGWPRRRSIAKVNGTERDLVWPLADGDEAAIVTETDERGLYTIRHSTAHVLAQAVLDLFPGATFAIGPPVEDGFYYDFELPDGGTFTPDDLDRIDARMREIIAETSRSSATRSPRATPWSCSRTTSTSARSSRARPRTPMSATDDRPRCRTYENPPPVHRPVPRPARAPHRAPRSLQADAGRRRLLARRREEPDAPAHLRHRVGVEEGARRSTCTASRRPRSATTASSAPSSTCSRSPRRSAPAWRCSTPRAASSAGSWRTTPASATSRPATSSCTRRTSPRRTCSRRAVTSTGTPTACTRRWSSTRAPTTTSSR